MKKSMVIAAAFSLCLGSSAYAKDVLQHHSIESARSNSVVEEVLSGPVSFYWGEQPHPAVAKNLGTYKTSKRANGFAKASENSCAQALASALLVFLDRADKEGGNAVINLRSNIRNRPESSSTEYSCLVGGMMVNVALKGDVVLLKK